MTLLKLKQEICRLSAKDRRELNAFMIRLRHERPEWRRKVSAQMRKMDAGEKTTLTDLEHKLRLD